MKPLALLSLFVLILTSCHDNNSDQPLTGTWEWAHSYGGFTGRTNDTPASTGKTMRWKFTNDQKYFFFTDGTLKSQGSFTLEKRKCVHTAEEKWFVSLSLETDLGFMIESLDKENLEISDEYMDGVGSQFKRALLPSATE